MTEAAAGGGRRVLFVSTWGAHCGIADYTQFLTGALTKRGWRTGVLAPIEEGSCIGAVSPSVAARPAWVRGHAGLGESLEPFSDVADVIHFQHEYGLFFPTETFLTAVESLARRRPVVVTLHTVFEYGEWAHTAFYDQLVRVASAVIVHTRAAWASVSIALGQPAAASAVEWIPHGVPTSVVGNAEAGRAYLQVPSTATSLGLVPGFQNPGKNTMCTLRAFAAARAQRVLHDNDYLAIVGSFSERGQASLYLAELRQAVSWAGLGKQIIVRNEHVSDKAMADLYAAADYGVLNTTSWNLSASGQVARFAAAGCPVAAAARPIYSDAVLGGALMFRVDDGSPAAPSQSAVAAIAALATRADVRSRLSDAQRAYAETRAWSLAAEAHERLYERLIENHRRHK